MSRFSRVLLACIACTAFTSPSHAEELTGTLKKIKDSGTIVLGHRESSIPFAYYDDKQQVVGDSMEIVYKIVDAVKKQLNMPNLQVKLNPVTSQRHAAFGAGTAVLVKDSRSLIS